MTAKPGKIKKPFSWDMFHERQIAIRISYIGWDLSGFVSQNETDETVEGYLFQALEKARLIKSRDKKECHYSLCGRTDAGVSGVGNVVSVRVRSIFPFGKGSIKNESAPIREEELNYIQILNGILPPMIRVTSIAYVDPDFNARHNCISRSYRYLFHMFDKNLDKMKEAANLLIGKHDFRNFCKFSPVNTTHCVREILSIQFHPISLENGLWYFQIVGTAFIWHQIRCIASILFLIGDGYEEPNLINELFDIKRFPGRPQYPIADPKPLIFWIAGYPDSIEWMEPKDGSAEKEKIITAFNQMLLDNDIRNGVLRMFTDGKIIDKKKKKHTPITSLQMAAPVEEVLQKYINQKGVDLDSEEESIDE